MLKNIKNDDLYLKLNGLTSMELEQIRPLLKSIFPLRLQILGNVNIDYTHYLLFNKITENENEIENENNDNKSNNEEKEKEKKKDKDKINDNEKGENLDEESKDENINININSIEGFN